MRGRTIEYSIRASARARHVGLTVYPGGALVATLPRGKRVEDAETLIRKKATWVVRTIERMKRMPFTPQKAGHYRKRYKTHREAARKLVHERLRAINSIYGFAYRTVSIRNQRSRWGSCSKRGNLNFNFRILFLPPPLADYLVAHELAHLAEPNHSPSFWALVAKAVPNPKAMRRELRTYDLRSA